MKIAWICTKLFFLLLRGEIHNNSKVPTVLKKDRLQNAVLRRIWKDLSALKVDT